ncbi:GNAT family N-acetyltransferase [Actinoplanes friuliensis]|uniref:Putative N-acetyltransferase n=1 Tax=Actinoplanes friuliensis DSM 7358 TaxID=1246995 RepID=U5W600_9ACTN|nr:GNAT family protein [Actinoplanes friuliensis]AGZ43430.1 putative N-acetyltransferase [Actinoplanes friuliensis DSM 7358]
MLDLVEPLVTPRLLLRPFRTGDEEALLDLRSRPEVVRHLYWPPPTPDGVRDVVRQRLTMTKLAADGDCLVLAAEDRETGRLLGELDLSLVSVENRHAEIGIILHPDAQGRGLATETARALLDLAFDRLDLHRVTASTNSGNEASARALLRLGFRQEGHLVQCVRFADAWHDELIFAMLASEWAGAPGRIVA